LTHLLGHPFILEERTVDPSGSKYEPRADEEVSAVERHRLKCRFGV